MYGEKITNLADGTDLSDAVTVKQLSSVSSYLVTEIESAVEGGVDELSTKVFVGNDSLSAKLATAISEEATRAAAAEDDLSDAIDVINGAGAGSISAAVDIAVAEANDYTDSVSAALSTDYV